MFVRGAAQTLPRQSAPGRLFYTHCGVPDLGLQLRARHAWQALRALPPPARLLDYGCGSGRVALACAARLPQCAVTGYDPDAAVIAAAQQRAHCGNVAFTAAAETIGSGYDTVLCLDVIAHVPDAAALGQALAAALLPGGHLLLHTPSGNATAHFARHRAFDGRQADRTRPHWSRPDLTAWCARHGFTPVGWRETFRRGGDGLAWELAQVFPAPWLTPLWYAWSVIGGMLPARGGGLLLVARRDTA